MTPVTSRRAWTEKVTTFQTYQNGIWRDSIARLGFVLGLGLLALAMQYLLAPRRGPLQTALANSPALSARTTRESGSCSRTCRATSTAPGTPTTTKRPNRVRPHRRRSVTGWVEDIAEELLGKGAEVLVTISNEAWFGSRELDQHVAMASVRCIE